MFSDFLKILDFKRSKKYIGFRVKIIFDGKMVLAVGHFINKFFDFHKHKEKL